MTRHARSHFLINVLQARWMLISVAYLLALALCLGLAIFGPLVEHVHDESLDEAARAQAARELLALHGRFWPAFAVIAAAFLAHQLFMSHRIAGPLYRLRVTLRDMTDGVYAPSIRLRKGDLLQEEAQVLNALLQRLREHHVRTKSLAETLQEPLEAIRKEAHRQNDVVTVERTDKMMLALTVMRAEYARFRVVDENPPTSKSNSAHPPAALPRTSGSSDLSGSSTPESSRADRK